MAFEERALVGVIIVQEIMLGVVLNCYVLAGGRFLRDVETGDAAGGKARDSRIPLISIIQDTGLFKDQRKIMDFFYIFNNRDGERFLKVQAALVGAAYPDRVAILGLVVKDFRSAQAVT